MLLFDLIYVAGWIAAAPWLVWRRVRYGKNRRGLAQKIFGTAPVFSGGNKAVIWLHAVSVGEVNLLPSLMRELAVKYSQHRMVVSTTTESGFDQAVARLGVENVFFFPFDFSWAVRRAVRRVRPELVILAELELWPNFLRICQREKAPVAVANARISDSSFRNYRRAAFLVRAMFGRLSFVGAQTESYAERFVALGVPRERVGTTGNLKFDGANTDRTAPAIRQLAEETGIDGTLPVFVAGSTQPDEHAMVLSAWLSARESVPGMRLVVVPRHPHTADSFCELLRAQGLPFARRSRKQRPSENPAEVIVVDVIGELAAWWGLATAGYVGGSMGRRGGQSMIEPAALGVPVCFGPQTANFRDVVEQLVARQGAVIVGDAAELSQFLVSLHSDAALRKQCGISARQLVLNSQGATARFLEGLDLLGSPGESGSVHPQGRAA